MSNEVVTAGTRAVSTPEGARALRSIACSAAWGERDIAEARRWLTPQQREQLPAARAEARVTLAAAVLGDARKFLGPTLSLVAPAGMSEDDQAAWLAAALDTLSGIPADLLERGCRKARRVADHPSKIVKAIFDEVGPEWDRRKRDLANVEFLAQVANGTAQPTRPWEDIGNVARRIATPDEIVAIKEEMGLDTKPYPEAPKPRGPLREPTVADYVELGMTRADAERAVAEKDQTRRDMAAAASGTPSSAPRQARDHLKEAGHILIAKLLALRIRDRRLPYGNVDQKTAQAKALIAKHGAPALPWLIAATRLELQVLGLAAAA